MTEPHQSADESSEKQREIRELVRLTAEFLGIRGEELDKALARVGMEGGRKDAAD